MTKNELVVDNFELPNGINIYQINYNETNFMYNEVFIDKEYYKNGIVVNEGDCVFDIGSNIGMFSVFMSNLEKDIRLYAFEPIPPLYQVLCKNMDRHNPKAKIYNMAFGETNKTEIFTFYPNNSIMSGLHTNEEDDKSCFLKTYIDKNLSDEDQELLLQYSNEILEGRFINEKYECTVTTIDDFIEKNNIDVIHLLKIDAEKSEYNILLGLAKNWDKVKQLVIEVHSEEILNNVTELLERKGYVLKIDNISGNLFLVYATLSC